MANSFGFWFGLRGSLFIRAFVVYSIARMVPEERKQVEKMGINFEVPGRKGFQISFLYCSTLENGRIQPARGVKGGFIC
jgi:hypothetical protein